MAKELDPSLARKLREIAQELLEAADTLDGRVTPPSTDGAQRRGRGRPRRVPREATSGEIGISADVLDKYLKSPHNPKFATAIWTEFWQGVGQSVPPCEIKPKRGGEGGIILYVPPEFSTQENRHHLGEIFPRMQIPDCQEGNSTVNEVDQSGWFILRPDKDRPTLNTYIICANFLKAAGGHYCDEDKGEYTLLASYFVGPVAVEKYPLYASCDKDGHLYVYPYLDKKVPSK